LDGKGGEQFPIPGKKTKAGSKFYLFAKAARKKELFNPAPTEFLP